MLRYLSAGESHGKSLVAILDGMPAGLKIDPTFINAELKRRQAGFGRGARMKIESDTVQILSGIRKKTTLGSPIALLIANRDATIETKPPVLCPRPGHADLAGILKYGFSDARDVLERASARSTASVVAAGAVCKIFLDKFGIHISSRVICVGGESEPGKIRSKIAQAIKEKDTVGGIFLVRAENVPPGLGSYVQSDKRLDSRLAGSIMAIPGVKGVEFGIGFEYGLRMGSEVHDAIYYVKSKGFVRKTNNAGGIEGGISNGQDIIICACMKPISTLMNPLASVNIVTKKAARACTERSDICVVESTGVVAEAICAYEIADAFLEKFGGDCIEDTKASCRAYLKRIKSGK